MLFKIFCNCFYFFKQFLQVIHSFLQVSISLNKCFYLFFLQFFFLQFFTIFYNFLQVCDSLFNLHKSLQCFSNVLICRGLVEMKQMDALYLNKYVNHDNVGQTVLRLLLHLFKELLSSLTTHNKYFGTKQVLLIKDFQFQTKIKRTGKD